MASLDGKNFDALEPAAFAVYKAKKRAQDTLVQEQRVEKIRSLFPLDMVTDRVDEFDHSHGTLPKSDLSLHFYSLIITGERHIFSAILFSDQGEKLEELTLLLEVRTTFGEYSNSLTSSTRNYRLLEDDDRGTISQLNFEKSSNEFTDSSIPIMNQNIDFLNKVHDQRNAQLRGFAGRIHSLFIEWKIFQNNNLGGIVTDYCFDFSPRIEHLVVKQPVPAKVARPFRPDSSQAVPGLMVTRSSSA